MSKKKILVISYFANLPGLCQGEWLDDKIYSLLQLNYEIILLSSIITKKYNNPFIKQYTVPSLSFVDFMDEYHRLKKLNLNLNLTTILFLPLIFTFGFLNDWLHKKVTGGIGEGKWAWTPTASLYAIFLSIIKQPELILTTGGPASAHLAGVVVKYLTKKTVICELQDPLSGSDIGRNQQSAGWLFKIEKLINAHIDKTVYVTERALQSAKKMFPNANLECVYPGSKPFNLPSKQKNLNTPLRLVHLGSLYSTRNFKSIIAALELLFSSGRLKKDSIKLINLGQITPEIKNDILHIPYVEIRPPISRIEALTFATESDIVLLIQNADDRSHLTIPYKTYDYLNLNTPILALLNNDELAQMINKNGHISCDLDNINDIAEKLFQLIDKLQKTQINSNTELKTTTVDCVKQTQKLIQLEI